MSVPARIKVTHNEEFAFPFAVYDDVQEGTGEIAPPVHVFKTIPALNGWLQQNDYRYVLDTCGCWVLP